MKVRFHTGPKFIKIVGAQTHSPPDVALRRSLKWSGTNSTDWAVAVARSVFSFVFQGTRFVGWLKLVRRFRGEGLNKVDSKGRVSIPALFRRVIEVCDPAWTDGLQPELVIVYGDNRKNFLECYTIDAIDEVDQKISDLPRGSIQRKMLERLFHGQSFPTSVDDTGRLVIPHKLREKIGIKAEAYFIASGDTFQIWNPATFQDDQDKANAWLQSLPEDFDPLIYLAASDSQPDE